MPWKSVTVSVVVAAAFYLTLFAGADLDASLAAAARLTWPWWLTILALSLVNYVLRYLRWDGYLRKAGHRLPVFRHLLVYLGGFALTTTPAKAGEAIRALYLRPLGVSVRRSIATLYAERVVDVISIALLAVMLYQLDVPGYRWVAILAACAAAALLLLQRRACLRAVGTLMRRLPWRSLRQAARHGVDCLRQAGTLLRGRMLAYGVGLGLVSWGAEALAFYLVVRVLDIPIELMPAVGIYATAMLAGALSFIPGGLGGTEAVMASLLILGGAPPPSAMAATTITRVATLWFAVAVGVLALLATEAAGRRAVAALPAGSGAGAGK
jgi:uncharacterized membrane protein YbhN (UPF0104 family)